MLDRNNNKMIPFPQAHPPQTYIGGLPMLRRLPSLCRCYVAALDYLTRFGLRRGAHAQDCPIYRPSRDPVDAAQDQKTRTHYTLGG